MKTKHTKGEWIVDDTIIYSLHQRGWEDGKPSMVNRMFINPQYDVTGKNPVTHEESIANAKLISAAPNLLEALIDLTELYEHSETIATTMHIASNYQGLAIAKAKAAIKKAIE